MRNERAYTLLEQALVFPAIIGFIVVALDVAHINRSYDALRQGVKTSLRCVYPASAACNEILASAPTALYDVTRYNINTTPLASEENYSGRSLFIRKPEYSLSNFSATVLSNVHFTQNMYRHRAEQRLFPANAQTGGGNLIQAFIPYISGSTPDNATFSYNYGNVPGGGAYPETSANVNFGNALLSSANRWVDDTTTSRDLGYYTIRLNRPAEAQSGSACYRSLEFNHGDGAPHAPNYAAPCAGPNYYDQHGAYVILWFRGNSQGSDNGTQASIQFSLEPAMSQANYTANFMQYTPNSNYAYTRQLGGRHYSSNPGTRDASLVPRGAFNDQFVEDTYNNHYSELTDYAKIFMLYDRTYRVKLNLFRTAGGVSGRTYYNPTDVELYTIKWNSFQGETLACANPILPSEQGDPSKCAGVPQSAISSGPTISSSSHTAVGQTLDLGLFAESQINLLSVLSTQVQHPEDYFPLTPLAEQQQSSLPCPAIGEGGNYGVQDQAVSGFIYNSSEAESICPAPSSGASGVYWSEVTQAVPGNPSAQVIRDDCSTTLDAKTVIPALAPYHKLSGITSFSGASGERIYTGQGAPETHHPDNVVSASYNCPVHGGGFSVGTETYSDATLRQAHPESLFVGFQYPLGCSAFDTLRDEAVSLGMDSGSYFELGVPELGERVELNSEPDSCTPHSYTSGSPTNPLYLGQFEEGSLPAECSVAGYTCELKFAGFNGDIPDDSGVTHDFAKAATEYGYPQISAVNPKARFGCQGVDCVSLSLNADSTTVTAQGTARVGLLNAFGAPIQFPITYSETEALEVNF